MTDKPPTDAELLEAVRVLGHASIALEYAVQAERNARETHATAYGTVRRLAMRKVQE